MDGAKTDALFLLPVREKKIEVVICLLILFSHTMHTFYPVMKPLAWNQSFPVDQSFSNNANARPFPVPILSLALA